MNSFRSGTEMTRINLIPPADLTDQHLMAEYRELPRIFPLARAAIAKGIVIGPARYTMGEGHIKFFYSRTDFLSARQGEIIQELLKRGYDIQHRTPPAPLDECGVSRWTPNQQDVEVNLQRLRERLREKPRGFYTKNKEPVELDFYGF